MDRIALAQHLEQFEPGAHHCGRQRVREKVRTRPLAQQRDDLLTAGREPAHGTAERLAQRTGDDIDLSAHIELFGHAAARLAHHAGRVALVHHHQRVVLLGQFANLVHRGDVAVH